MSEDKAMCGAEWKPLGDCEDCSVDGSCCFHCEAKNECSFVCVTKERADYLRKSTIAQLLSGLGERLAAREIYPLEFAEISRRFSDEEKPLRPELKRFVQLMETKLIENEDKGGWRHCDIWHLQNKANIHMARLNMAIERKDPDAILKASLNLANYCMMFGDRQLPEVEMEGK